jgi:hypothetical protein
MESRSTHEARDRSGRSGRCTTVHGVGGIRWIAQVDASDPSINQMTKSRTNGSCNAIWDTVYDVTAQGEAAGGRY